MTGAAMILLLTLAQFAIGFGILGLLRLQFRPWLFIPVAVILGMGIFSLVPFVLQLIHIPLTTLSVFGAIGMLAVLLNIGSKKHWVSFASSVRALRLTTELYEIPFLLLTAFIVFVSVWRCYYFPPTPRDLTSGPEVIAEYAVKEKTMINSVFTVDLHTTNNQYKPPYLTSLQLIYKLAGFPFGQVWLSTLFICFLVFLFHALLIYLHRLLAWSLILFLLAVPEMYAYTFMALFDYSNAVFFTLSAWFLFDYFSSRKANVLFLAGIFMALATYARSETLALAALLFLSLFWYHIRNWNSLRMIVKTSTTFLAPSVLVYLLSVTVYIRLYLPTDYHISALINPQLFNPLALAERFADVNTRLLISDQSFSYYGYFNYFFFVLFVFDLVLTDKWLPAPRNWLFAVLVVYFGLPLVGHILPLMDIDHSTKRGLFKMFPLMLLYMGSSGVLTGLSEKISKWEKI